jgi:hypothetical protein
MGNQSVVRWGVAFAMLLTFSKASFATDRVSPPARDGRFARPIIKKGLEKKLFEPGHIVSAGGKLVRVTAAQSQPDPGKLHVLYAVDSEGMGHRVDKAVIDLNTKEVSQRPFDLDIFKRDSRALATLRAAGVDVRAETGRARYPKSEGLSRSGKREFFRNPRDGSRVSVSMDGTAAARLEKPGEPDAGFASREAEFRLYPPVSPVRIVLRNMLRNRTTAARYDFEQTFHVVDGRIVKLPDHPPVGPGSYRSSP